MSKQINVRELAVEVLLKVEREDCKLNETLQQQLLKYQYMDKSDRAFLTRLCEGTMEYQLRIDYMINQVSNTPLSKCKPFIRCLLRMGTYQIHFLDSVPDSAACNESVKLAKKKGFVKLSGFVNGVLRNVARQKETIVYPDAAKDYEEYLSIMYSIPKWLITQWCQQYGKEKAAQMAVAANEKAPTTVRNNTMLCTKEECIKALEKEGVKIRAIPLIKELGDWYSDIEKQAFVLEQYDYLSRYEAFQKGWFAVQDVSSMLPGMAAVKELEKIGVKEDTLVMDVCAAPGGKTAFVAACMKGMGKVLARDVSESKVEKIKENCKRLHLTNVVTQVYDARKPEIDKKETADVLLCDAPCSGLGVIGRKKEIRYRMSEELEQELENLQKDILMAVKDYVKPDGLLIYSTCTVNQRENEDNIKWFLNHCREYELIEEIQLLPGVHSCDGFYFAKIRKKKR